MRGPQGLRLRCKRPPGPAFKSNDQHARCALCSWGACPPTRADCTSPCAPRLPQAGSRADSGWKKAGNSCPRPTGLAWDPPRPTPPATLVFPPSPPFPNFLFSFSSSSPALHYAMKTMPMVVTRRTSVALELPGQAELALAETPGHAPRQLSPHRPPRTRS